MRLSVTVAGLARQNIDVLAGHRMAKIYALPTPAVTDRESGVPPWSDGPASPTDKTAADGY